MNIFSNIGITELVFILVLALLVVGPERLPELARSLAKGLRDLRRVYENLSKDLGPELMSIQQTTQELRESVDAVRSIPRDAVQSVVKAADLEETTKDLKALTQELGQAGRTLASAGEAIHNPISAAASAARDALEQRAEPPDQEGVEPATEEIPEREPHQPDATAQPKVPETRLGPAEVSYPAKQGEMLAEEEESGGCGAVEEATDD